MAGDFEKLYAFEALYRAHRAARRGKQNTAEVIEFEMNLADRLTRLSDALKSGTYSMKGYYRFPVYDPKHRIIHALHYRDRVVQHCLCDCILAPALDKRLIYDNAACRKNKGTHFAQDRLSGFLRAHYREHSTRGYILKFDIRKYFDSIDHDVLKQKLEQVIRDKRVYDFLCMIIDSYEVTPGKGIPLGNQTSQWFALYYLDSLDRLIKQELRVKHYVRYMDDGVIVMKDREELRRVLKRIREHTEGELLLEFNEKTEVFPIKCGVNFLGFHFYITDTGRVVRRVLRKTVRRYHRRLEEMQKDYALGRTDIEAVKQVLISYRGHFFHANAYSLQREALNGLCW